VRDGRRVIIREGLGNELLPLVPVENEEEEIRKRRPRESSSVKRASRERGGSWCGVGERGNRDQEDSDSRPTSQVALFRLERT